MVLGRELDEFNGSSSAYCPDIEGVSIEVTREITLSVITSLSLFLILLLPYMGWGLNICLARRSQFPGREAPLRGGRAQLVLAAGCVSPRFIQGCHTAR